MNYIQRIEYWGDHHHPKWMDIVRIALGLFLLFKGAEFASNLGSIMSLMESSVPFSSLVLIILGHYILFAHLLGGFLLTLGLLTRFACIIQIPILLGAIFFINISGGIFDQFSQLLMSILVLLLLVYFLVIGSGPWSFDTIIEEENRTWK